MVGHGKKLEEAWGEHAIFFPAEQFQWLSMWQALSYYPNENAFLKHGMSASCGNDSQSEKKLLAHSQR